MSFCVKVLVYCYMKERLAKLDRYSSFIPFILISALTFLLYEQTYAPNGIVFPNQDFMGILFLAVANLSLVAFSSFVQQFDHNQKKIRLMLLYGLLIVMAFGILNLIIMPLEQTIEVKDSQGAIANLVLSITQADKFRSLILLLVSGSFIYIMAIVLPRKNYFRDFVLVVSYGVILYALAIAIYSFVKEFQVYVDLIKIGYGKPGVDVPVGPYDNRNTFASFLLTGFMFLVFLYFFNKSRKFRYVFIALTIPLLIAIYFTFSKTNMVLSALTFILVFLRHNFLLFKRHKIRFFIEWALVVIFITFLLIFRFVPVLQLTLVGRAITNLTPPDLIEIGGRTLAARVEMWRLAIEIIIARPRTLLLGDGIYISRVLYNDRLVLADPSWSVTGYGNYHNGYLEIFHTFGLVGLLVYLAIIVIIFIKIIGFLKKMPAPGYFLLLALFVFLSRASVESIILFAFKTESVLASFTLIFPYFYFSNLKQEQKNRTLELIKTVSA